jgi:hypothetical protein
MHLTIVRQSSRDVRRHDTTQNHSMQKTKKYRKKMLSQGKNRASGQGIMRYIARWSAGGHARRRIGTLSLEAYGRKVSDDA